jgi:hypothetical protein
MVEKGTFFGNKSQLMALLESTTKWQDVQSVLVLLDERAKLCHPMWFDWLESTARFADSFIRFETRESIRLHATRHLRRIYALCREAFAEEFVETIVMNSFTPEVVATMDSTHTTMMDA